MTSLTCRKVVKRGKKFYVRWSDKTENEFASEQEARDYVTATLNEEVLRALMVARWLEDFTGNPKIEGKTITLELSHPGNIVRVT